jgi:integrase
MQYSLRCFLRFCYIQEYVSSDLSSAVPVFRSPRLSSVPKAIDDDTVRQLLNSIDTKTAIGLRDLAILRLLITYGVRSIQVRKLRLEDIRWADNRIHFRAVKKGKEINQHLTPEVGNSLLSYIREARPNSVPHVEVFLISRPPFHPIKAASSIRSMIAERLRRIGAQLPEGVSHGAHSFRHAFATRLAGEVPFKHIADMLGHRDLSSSFIYSKVNFSALDKTAQPWPEEVTR